MEDPKETDPKLEKASERAPPDFNREELSIEVEESKDGKQTFYVKSEEFFQKIGDAINNAINYFKFTFKNNISDINENPFEETKLKQWEHKR